MCIRDRVKKAIDSLNILGQRASIVLVWTRAHVGTRGNKEADRLAKEGAEKEIIDVRTLLPRSYVKNQINEKIYEYWKTEWTVYNAGRQTKQFFPSADPSKTKSMLSLSRHDLSRLVRLITGHNTLNYHMSLTTPGTDPRCRFCYEEPETFFHFITNCPRLRAYRAQIFNDYDGPVLETWNPEDLVEFSKLRVISDAVDYYDWSEEVKSDIFMESDDSM